MASTALSTGTTDELALEEAGLNEERRILDQQINIAELKRQNNKKRARLAPLPASRMWCTRCEEWQLRNILVYLIAFALLSLCVVLGFEIALIAIGMPGTTGWGLSVTNVVLLCCFIILLLLSAWLVVVMYYRTQREPINV